MSGAVRCTECGTPAAPGAAFCETCGARLSAPEGVAAPGERSRRSLPGRLLVVLGIALAAAAAGFLAGYLVADDADRIDALERARDKARVERDSAEAERDSAEGERAAAESENEQLSGEITDLEEQLDAERGLRGTGDSSATAGPPPDADLRLGQAGRVGSLIVKPTSFESTGSSGQAVSYLLVMTVKNDGTEPAGPFCGGSEATVNDDKGRTFDGEAVIAEDTPNCGDDLQPGLTADNFQIRFRLPPDATPAVLRIVEEFTEEGGTTWALPD
jgi:hypothetical protein